MDLEEQNQEHELTYDECFDYLRQSGNTEAFDRFTSIMLNVVAINGLDYRKCPQANCDYIGTIDLKPCHELLQCEKCEYEWTDPALYPLCKRLSLKFQNLMSFNSDFFNNIQKVVRGEPCPNCGICIIKLEG